MRKVSILQGGVSLECKFRDIKGVLTGEQIKELIRKKYMVSDYIDLDKQLQVHGFDVTVAEVYELIWVGEISFEDKALPEYKSLDGEEWTLFPGVYIVRLNEKVKLPRCICAVVLPRSSLIRMGAQLVSALWDAGYEGKGVLMLVVHNTIKLKKNARIGQMIFMKLAKPVKKGYDGTYKGEGI